jgi:hypothetical protein
MGSVRVKFDDGIRDVEAMPVIASRKDIMSGVSFGEYEPIDMEGYEFVRSLTSKEYEFVAVVKK